MFRVTARIDIAPEALIKCLQDTEKITKWNTTLTEHKVLKVSYFAYIFKLNNLKMNFDFEKAIFI